MMKVLARPTNNAERFVDKEENFKYEHFTKFCAGLHEILASTGSTSQLLSVASMS